MATNSEAPIKTPRELTELAKTENSDQTSMALTTMGSSEALVASIDWNRWDKLYPYALIIADAPSTAGGKYQQKARFVLPIPPESLQILTPFAIQTTKTLGGTVEEHAGMPFKLISLAGTTGLYPLRGNAGGITPTGGSILGGTIEAAKNLGQAASDLSAAVSGTTPPARGGVSTQIEDLKGTGYGQFMLLRLFLENYVRQKKANNQNKRLLFAVYKEQVAYVVTPISFNVKREAGRALKYRYELQLKAWDEVSTATWMNVGAKEDSSLLGRLSRTLSQILRVVQAAQRVLTSARSVVNAFRADIQQILDVVRQTALAIKLAIQTTRSLIDLPHQLWADLKAVVEQSWDLIQDELKGQDTLLGYIAKVDGGQQNAKFKAQSGADKPWQPDPSVLDALFADPNSEATVALFSAVDIDKLRIPAALATKIEEEFTRVSSFRPSDYARMRDQVMTSMVSIADSIGASSATFDTTYSNVHAAITRVPNNEDFAVLFAINDILDSLNQLAAEPDQQQLTTSEYVAGLAAGSGIAFKVPISKMPVPFPYDTTLEQLALQYLGDPDRWMEIATLNGLREPYVDEIGFTYPLIANGSLSEVVVASDANLHIGQAVWLQSNFAYREKRHILNINRVSAGQVILTLDGEPDLSKYVVSAAAYLQAFLPDTVNSHQIIYIPSDIPVPDNSELAQIPGVDAFDNLLEQGGVDLLLTNDNDLAITNDGDCKLAFGLQAIVQRARVTLSTIQGSLIRHPSFGLPIKVGMSVADLDLPQLTTACHSLFAEDPTFNGVTNVSISQSGSAVQINLGIGVVGQNLPISLSFNVKR